MGCLGCFYGVPTRQEAIDATGKVRQVQSVASRYFCGHITCIPDVGEGPPDRSPVDVAFAKVSPKKPAVCAIQLEVLQVHLDDAAPENADPILRKPVKHDV